MRQTLLIIFLIAPGVAILAVCGYYALQDWGQLQVAYANYRAVAASNADMRSLFIAHAEQNIHRVNLFADGVWALLGAILAGIGVHGLCVMGAGRGTSREDGTAARA